VVEELLPVVGHEDDERAIVEAALLEPAHEAPELLVAEGDVAVVLRNHPLPVERLLVVAARVLRRVIGRGMGLVLAVEGRRGRVGDVRVHGVHVEEGREAAAHVQPRERGVHHHVRAHELARAVALAVQPREVVEAAVEARLRAVDHGVRDRGAGGVALGLQHLGERDVRGVERIAQLHRAVLPGQERREDRGDGRLRPRGLGHRLLEHDRVPGEGVERGRRVALVAVGPRVVGPQRVHEVDDHERRVRRGRRDGRSSPERLAGIARGIEAARLQCQLDVSAGVLGEIHVRGDPAPVLRMRQRIEELRIERVLASGAPDLDDKLDARPVLELRRDRSGEGEPRSRRYVQPERDVAGRPAGQRAPHHVVDSDRLSHGLLEAVAVERSRARVDQAVSRAHEVDGRRLVPTSGDGEGGRGRCPPHPSPRCAHGQTLKLARPAGRDQTTL
jgi:hypothetical protein